MGLFRTFLIIILIFAIIRFFTRVILPLVMKSYIDKKRNEFYGKMNNRRPKRQEGEVHIDYDPKKDNGRKSVDKGEFTDYEELN